MHHPHLLAPYERGRLRLSHRVAMAPMTRNRAADTIPGPLNATYYAQRATASILVTEGTQPSMAGQAYLATPGLHSDAQEAGWAGVARAVKEAGDARLVIQIMHGGRISHPYYTGGQTPMAPSAIRAAGDVFTPDGMLELVTPRAMSSDDLVVVREEHVAAARRAIAAGADGVELHGANGYLLHQFLSSHTNQRTDGYGTDVAGRIRFVTELVDAVSEAIGEFRVAVRLSPGNPFNDMREPDARRTYDALLRELAERPLMYLHMVETQASVGYSTIEQARPLWPGTLMANAGFDQAFDLPEADRLIAEGAVDVVAFGRRFLANPDLPRRLAEGIELNAPQETTFYTSGREGYIDYPSLA